MLISSRGGKNFIQSWTALFQKQQWTNRDQHPEKWVRTVSQGPLSWCPVCPVMVRGFYISEGKQLSELQLFQSWKLFQGRAQLFSKRANGLLSKRKNGTFSLLSLTLTQCCHLWHRWAGETWLGGEGFPVWVCQSAGKSSLESRLLWAGQVELRWNYPEKMRKIVGGKKKILGRSFPRLKSR